MTATCICKPPRLFRTLPLELDRKFYCGSCGGLFEGVHARMAKEMWEMTGRINASSMIAVVREAVTMVRPKKKRRSVRPVTTKKGRSIRAKKGRDRD